MQQVSGSGAVDEDLAGGAARHHQPTSGDLHADRVGAAVLSAGQEDLQVRLVDPASPDRSVGHPADVEVRRAGLADDAFRICLVPWDHVAVEGWRS